MKALYTFAVVLLLATWSVPSAQTGLSAEALLDAAIQREVVDRDFTGAMSQYRDIAARYPSNRAVAAKALLQLGALYERLGREDARPTYQRIVVEYADTGATALAARTRLAAIQQAAAGPFRMRDLDPLVAGATDLSVAPDGRHLVYFRARSPRVTASQGAGTLHLREVPSGREHELFEVPSYYGRQMIWSPDGRRAGVVVYTTPNEWEARIITVANRQVRTLSKGAHPTAFSWRSWSPDARHVAYFERTNPDFVELRVTAVDGPGAPQTIERLPQWDPWMVVAWAADSRRLAYALPGTAATDTIRVMTIGTTEPTSLPFSKAGPTSRTRVRRWPQSGEVELLQSVTGGNDIFLLDAVTGSARKVCEGRGASGGDGCANGGLSPDGRWAVVRRNVSEGGRIVLRNVVDGSERPLTTAAVWEQVVGFSPDNRLFAFLSNRDGAYGVYVVPVDSAPVSEPVRIAPMESQGGAIAYWTTSGMVLSMTDNQINQYRVDMDPRTFRPMSAPVRLTQDSPTNLRAIPSPDGRRIAYVSHGRPAGLAVMEANGSRERIVKEVPGDMLRRMEIIGWTGGDEIAYADAGLGTVNPTRTARTISLLNVTTGATRQLPATVTGAGLTIIGDSLFYFDREKDQSHTRPIAGGEERLGATMPPNWWSREVSRDGRSAVYSTVNESSPRGTPWPAEIRLRSLATGTDTLLAKFDDSNGGFTVPLDLSSDGRFLLYQDAEPRLHVMNVETRESWPLMATVPAGLNFAYGPARWAPDGSYVIVQGSSSRTTLRSFEGVTYDAVKRLTTTSR